MPLRLSVDRLTSLAVLLAIPVLLLALWRSTSATRATAMNWIDARGRKQLANSIFSSYSGNATVGHGTSLVLLEFSDYECPACVAAHRLMDTSAANSKSVKIALRYYARADIAPDALLAARASICAGRRDRFDLVHRALVAMPESVTDKNFSTYR